MYSLHRYAVQIRQTFCSLTSVLSVAQAQTAESSNPTLDQLQSGIDELHAEIRELKAYDASGTADWMRGQYIPWCLGHNYRNASVPYFSGPGVVAPPGGKPRAPGSVVLGWASAPQRPEQRATAVPLVNCEWITGDSYV